MIGETSVTLPIAESVIALLRYQLEIRRDCDPVDAENTIAMLEEKIRRALARGSQRGRDLKRRLSYQRYGIWAWDTALGNLLKAGEVRRDSKADTYWMASAVSTSVSTPKTGISGNGHAC